MSEAIPSPITPFLSRQSVAKSGSHHGRRMHWDCPLCPNSWEEVSHHDPQRDFPRSKGPIPCATESDMEQFLEYRIRYHYWTTHRDSVEWSLDE